MPKRNSGKTPNKMNSDSTSNDEVAEAKCMDQATTAGGKQNLLSEEELERLAAEEILRETKLASQRADTVGSLGWQKRKVKLNRRFVSNTVLQTLKSNKSKYS